MAQAKVNKQTLILKRFKFWREICQFCDLGFPAGVVALHSLILYLDSLNSIDHKENSDIILVLTSTTMCTMGRGWGGYFAVQGKQTLFVILKLNHCWPHKTPDSPKQLSVSPDSPNTHQCHQTHPNTCQCHQFSMAWLQMNYIQMNHLNKHKCQSSYSPWSQLYLTKKSVCFF